MTPTARSRVNLTNAQKSTGPKTTEGKRRASKNALRHGLSIPVSFDPELSKDVACLARLIAGKEANPRRLEAAWRVAEPQIDLIRLRRARLLLLSDPTASTRQPTAGEKLAAAALALNRLADPKAVVRFDEVKDREAGLDAVPVDLAIEFLAPKLIRLDRYERRALSLRKKAIRAFNRLYIYSSVDSKKGGCSAVIDNVAATTPQGALREQKS